MITLEGEITETTSPPNKAGQQKMVTIWIPETEEHMEFTFDLGKFQESGMKVGEKVSIKIEKVFDIDSLTPKFFGN